MEVLPLDIISVIVSLAVIIYILFFAYKMRTEIRETNDLVEQLQKTIQDKEQFVDKSLSNLESSQSRLSKLVAKLEHAQARLFWYQEKYDRVKDPVTGKFKRRNNG